MLCIHDLHNRALVKTRDQDVPHCVNIVSLGAADFELEELRGKLDEQGLAIAEKQEASVNSRKKLAETTKGGRLLDVLYSTNRRWTVQCVK